MVVVVVIANTDLRFIFMMLILCLKEKASKTNTQIQYQQKTKNRILAAKSLLLAQISSIRLDETSMEYMLVDTEIAFAMAMLTFRSTPD
jgi:hypothetical protein